MSHNTVVIDGRESSLDPEHSGNRLRAFVADDCGFQLVEAESVTAYADALRYRRTLIMIGEDARDAYLVDVFQVAGGKQHDYLLLGSADDDSTATVTGTLMRPFSGTLMDPGLTFRRPRAETETAGKDGATYGFVHHLSRGRARGNVVLDLRLDASPKIGTRTILLPEKNTALYLGRAPSIRRARRVDADVDKYQAPFFCARRRGHDLKSVFVAVHEPISGTPKIVEARVNRTADAVILVLDRGDTGADYVIVGLDGAVKVSQGALSFDGRYGFVRARGANVLQAHMVGATQLDFERFSLKATPQWSGTIRRATAERSEDARGAFEVSEKMPPDCATCTLVVTHPDGSTHGYGVLRIESIENGSRLFVRESPGFEITRKGRTQWTAFPQRTMKGTRNAYEILNAKHYVAGGD
jgi:hypothetical protein